MNVFVQEDDKEMQKTIRDNYQKSNYQIQFLPNDFSVFELLSFNPDIIVQDFRNNNVINCFEWSSQY